MDRKIELMFKTKPMLMRPPKSLHKINFPVSDYSEVISALRKYERTGFHENYIINSMFNFHFNDKNHVILVSLKNQNKSLCVCRVLGVDLLYYVGESLCGLGYIICYV
tara:strand:- start:69 stop:392 length:324 start_codon:yes stop_codon:yes gene_type:complete